MKTVARRAAAAGPIGSRWGDVDWRIGCARDDTPAAKNLRRGSRKKTGRVFQLDKTLSMTTLEIATTHHPEHFA